MERGASPPALCLILYARVTSTTMQAGSSILQTRSDRPWFLLIIDVGLGSHSRWMFYYHMGAHPAKGECLLPDIG